MKQKFVSNRTIRENDFFCTTGQLGYKHNFIKNIFPQKNFPSYIFVKT
jgi:hypothetical protein